VLIDDGEYPAIKPFGLSRTSYIDEIMDFASTNKRAAVEFLDNKEVDPEMIGFVSEMSLKTTDLLVASEHFRMVRLMSGTKQQDNSTNEMSAMFPDYHAYYHYLSIFSDLFPRSKARPMLVTTMSTVVPIVQSATTLRCGEFKLASVIVGNTENVMRTLKSECRKQYTTEGGADAIAFFLDLNNTEFNSDYEPDVRYRYPHAWRSALRANTVSRARNLVVLRDLYDSMSVGYLSGVVVLPQLAHPDLYHMLLMLMSESKHSVKIYPPNKMHDTHFYLKITPLPVKITGVIGSWDNRLFVERKVKSMKVCLTWLYYHVMRGIYNRHFLWEVNPTHVSSFTSERVKHLKSVGCNFVVKNKRVMYVQELVIKKLYSTERNAKNKKAFVERRNQWTKLAKMVGESVKMGKTLNAAVPARK